MAKTLNSDELGRILRRMYDKAPRHRQVAFIHLFGILYADHIGTQQAPIREIVEASGLSINYVGEVNLGRRLAEYVTIKPEQQDFLTLLPSVSVGNA